jgi:hypothetical protein
MVRWISSTGYRSVDERIGAQQNRLRSLCLYDAPSNVLAWQVPVDSLYLRAAPSDPRARANPVRGSLRATRARSAPPTEVAHRDAIASTRQEVLGNTGPGLEGPGPERAPARRPPTARSNSARNTIRHLGKPSTDGHRRRHSRECSAHSRRACPESPRTRGGPVAESRYQCVLALEHAPLRLW